MNTTHDLTKSNCPHCGAKNDTNLYEIDYDKHTVKRIDQTDQTDHRCLQMAETELAEAAAVLETVRTNAWAEILSASAETSKWLAKHGELLEQLSETQIERDVAQAIALVNADEREEARAVLREVEWVDIGTLNKHCPVCDHESPDGHAPCCRLARAIAP